MFTKHEVDMNESFCTCGRKHEWPDSPAVALCICGTFQEPMTQAELETTRAAHTELLAHLAALTGSVVHYLGLPV